MTSRSRRLVSVLLALVVGLGSVLALVGPAEARRPQTIPLKGTLTVSRTVAISGETLTFSGKVPSKKRMRPVVLQRKAGAAWVAVKRARTAKTGRFTMVAKTTVVGTRTYRVLAPKAKLKKQKLVAVRTPMRVVKTARQTATLNVPASGAATVTKPFTMTARFTPARTGRTVRIQEYYGGAWRLVGTGTTNSLGVAKVGTTAMGTVGGSFKFRAVALARAGAKAIGSASRMVNVFGDPAAEAFPGSVANANTPRVIDPNRDDDIDVGVRVLQEAGGWMYAGGEFAKVQDAGTNGTTEHIRTNLFRFDPSTGAVDPGFNRVLTGPARADGGIPAEVYAMASDGTSLYIGGDFTSVDGDPANRLVKIDATTGAVDMSFTSPLGNTATRVSDLEVVEDQFGDKQLVIAGTFPGGIMGADPDTGLKNAYFDGTQASGNQPSGCDPQTDNQCWSNRIYRFAANTDPATGVATRLAVIGAFQTIGSDLRQQVAVIDIDDPAGATVSPWHSTRWTNNCAPRLAFYARDVDWSPDGSYFAVGTTGGGYPNTPKLCDTVSAWNFGPANETAADQQPRWVQYSGGDTFHSVTIRPNAVYVGGHFRWLDNPQGKDFKGPGAVDRQGLGALDPATGEAFTWNPTKGIDGGLGAFQLYFTTAGMWVAHFENRLGAAAGDSNLHEGLGLLPF